MSLQASLEEQMLSALPDVQGNLAKRACACQGQLALGLFTSFFSLFFITYLWVVGLWWGLHSVGWGALGQRVQ